MTAQITIRGARLHNLKDISLQIPKFKLVALTGLSGSGKSTLGFDLILKEGQRQYLESLGLLPFGMAKPQVDEIQGISPTISVEQNLANRNPRSTVGTSTGVFTTLRVLFARLGRRPCPACGGEIPPPFNRDRTGWKRGANSDGVREDIQEILQCPRCGCAVPKLDMAHFSFNKPSGACSTCTGLGVVHHVDIHRLVDLDKSIHDGAVYGWNNHAIQHHSATLQAAADHYGIDIDLSLPVRDFTPIQQDLFFYGVESSDFKRHFPGVKPPDMVRKGRFEGLTTSLLRRYSERVQEGGVAGHLESYLVREICPDCRGMRLSMESRVVTVLGKTIVSLSQLPLSELGAWCSDLKANLVGDEQVIARPLLADLDDRINRLVNAGAGYLTPEQGSPTLSTGEAQRLRLASLLGSGLNGVVYILDEPTIGTHPRDTCRLIEMLWKLRDLGNTVLVIEHDLELISAADYVVDLGPGGGKNGGEVVATGTPAEISQVVGSLTGGYLSSRLSTPILPTRRSPGRGAITVRGARLHNLKNITVRLPLGMLVAVTGVSGAGKSSLVFDTLAPALQRCLQGYQDAPGACDVIEGWEDLDRVLTIDQHQLRRMPRSNAATYTGSFTAIRKTFAATVEAKKRGYTASHFSFNVSGGRCETCKGSGIQSIEMYFLPDAELPCPTCRGPRYLPEILSVKYQGNNIYQVLEMTMDQALELFVKEPSVVSHLQAMCDIGLGYLKLGQPSTTLSGGEAQRVKLAKELGWRTGGRTCYLLDEPTTGLHPADTVRLLNLLQQLVDDGHSVVVIEHNLDLISAADWVIDLGPEGGEGGGRLVAEGTPEALSKVPGSHTGEVLKRWLNRC